MVVQGAHVAIAMDEKVNCKTFMLLRACDSLRQVNSMPVPCGDSICFIPAGNDARTQTNGMWWSRAAQ